MSGDAPKAYPGYATPVITQGDPRDERWVVGADPWKVCVGWVDQHDAGWTAYAPRTVNGVTAGIGLYVGLYPDQQAAAEALVQHAGYGLL